MSAPPSTGPMGPAQQMPPPTYGAPMPMYAAPPPQQTLIPIVGGAMLLIAGIISLTNWAFIAAMATEASSVVPVGGEFIADILLICGAIGIILSLFPLLGGVFALRRKLWGLGLAGGIIGLFTIGWFFLGSLFSLIGLILVAISHKEFT